MPTRNTRPLTGPMQAYLRRQNGENVDVTAVTAATLKALEKRGLVKRRQTTGRLTTRAYFLTDEGRAEAGRLATEAARRATSAHRTIPPAGGTE